MTNWLPDLPRNGNPLYIELADAISRDIENGTLKPGTKLPPHRNIAFDIGVTVGTISRGYALAMERGLVSGEVGRGTYVLERYQKATSHSSPFSKLPVPASVHDETIYTAHDNFLDLAYTSAINVGQTKIIADIRNQVILTNPDETLEYIRDTPDSWLKAGQQWLSSAGWKPDIESIVMTNGAYAAANAIITAMTVAGDKIVFENLSYSAIARGAILLGRRIITCDFDDNGIIPEAFEKLCAQQHPKILYLMPSIHNPTLAKLNEDRRKAIAEIAHRYNVWVIEDSIYAPLVGDPVKPIAHFAPDKCFYVGGISKAVSAGLRVGWASCPPNLSNRIANAHKLLMGPSSYLMMETGANLVLGGHADHILEQVQSEIRNRTHLACDILKGCDFSYHNTCPYLWLRLPDPWNSGTFQNALSQHNIMVSNEDEFKPSRSEHTFHAVRIGMTAARATEELRRPLTTIRTLLDSGIAGYQVSN